MVTVSWVMQFAGLLVGVLDVVAVGLGFFSGGFWLLDLVCGFEFMRCGCEFVVVSFAFGCWAGAVCFAAGDDLDWIVWQVLW